MFVRKIEDLAGSDKEMKLTDGDRFLRSIRFLTQEDGCGFSISDVLIKGGRSLDLHYKNHVEANFILEGQVTVQDLTSNQSWDLTAGMLYVVGPKDRHRMSAAGDVRLLSVFSPGITGTERHDADGAFPPTGEIPPAWQGEAGRTMFVMGQDDAIKVVLRGGRTRASRFLNRDYGCGFTISMPRGTAGNESILWYKNHVEANLILEGEAELEDLTSKETWDLAPGTLYVVGPRDRHRLTAKTNTALFCVFNPALNGDETHDAEGAYAPTGEIPSAWRA